MCETEVVGRTRRKTNEQERVKMGLFERLFAKPQIINAKDTFKLLNGYTPAFHNWKGSIYEADLVRSSIDAIARHSAKLKPEFLGSAKQTTRTTLKNQPNEMQTWSQFLYRTATILYVNNTCFIVPVIDQYGETKGIYSIIPDSWELLKTKNETPYIKFYMENGKSVVMELAKVGILTRFQYKSDLFGESNNSMNSVMNLIHIQDQGITEGVKNGASFRFMATMSNFASDEDIKNESQRFTREQLQSGGGLLLFNNIFKDIKQIDSKPFIIDEAQIKVINERCFNYFGVNEDILQNRCYGDKWSAFYEGCIEGFAIQLSEVCSKMLFTNKEQSNGNAVMFTSNRLQYMSNTDKLTMTSQLIDRGMLTLNEAREVWNLPPVDGGGVRYIRGEYYDADKKDEVTKDE